MPTLPIRRSPLAIRVMQRTGPGRSYPARRNALAAASQSRLGSGTMKEGVVNAFARSIFSKAELLRSPDLSQREQRRVLEAIDVDIRKCTDLIQPEASDAALALAAGKPSWRLAGPDRRELPGVTTVHGARSRPLLSSHRSASKPGKAEPVIDPST
jgi:hypothetical protein